MRWLIVAALLLTAQAPADPIKPDSSLTPGAWRMPPTPLAVLCTPGYSRTVRHVSEHLKDEVFRRYGYDPSRVTKSLYEVDHLVPLSLDGLNDIENLWPESYVTSPLNAHRKDALEYTLHHLVCARPVGPCGWLRTRLP